MCSLVLTQERLALYEPTRQLANIRRSDPKFKQIVFEPTEDNRLQITIPETAVGEVKSRHRGTLTITVSLPGNEDATAIIDAVMRFRWSLASNRNQGVMLVLDDLWPGFNSALEDHVEGWMDESRLLQWLDTFLTRLEAESDNDGRKVYISNGNISELIRIDDQVIAISVISIHKDEYIPVADLLPAIREWHALVRKRALSAPATDNRREPQVVPPGPHPGEPIPL